MFRKRTAYIAVLDGSLISTGESMKKAPMWLTILALVCGLLGATLSVLNLVLRLI